MKKLLLLIGILCAVWSPKAAHALACNLSSGASVATINSAIQAARSGSCTGTATGNTVELGAGTYSVTGSQIQFPCTSGSQAVTLTGPIITLPPPGGTWNIYTASLQGPYSTSNGFGVDVSCGGVTIQDLEWNGNRPQPGGGGFLYKHVGVSNLTITHNYIHGVQAYYYSSGQPDYEIMILLDGQDSRTTGAVASSNINVSWNQIGPVNPAGDPDCSNWMSKFQNPSGGNYDNTNTSGCGEVQVRGNITNSSFDHNRNWGIFQVYKYPDGTAYPNNYEALYTNMYEAYNDITNCHRNCTEGQGRAQGGSQSAGGLTMQYNDLHDQYAPGYDDMGFSLPSCCGGLNVNAANGRIATPNYTNALDNVIIANVASLTHPQGIPEALEMGSDGSFDHNLIQGNWGIGVNYSDSTGSWTISYNVYQNVNGSTSGPEQSCPGSCSPAKIGNTSSSTPTAQISAAPTISPTPTGTYSGSVTVTLTDNGYTGTTPGPRANTGIYYTTDGSTPTTSSTWCYQTCSFSVAAGATVRAIGMWGAQNQPIAYPTGYGFVPSGVVSATYPSGGAAPTLTGVSLTLQDGTSTVQVGNSKQACAVTTYSSGPGYTTCGASADGNGTSINTWTSSVSANASITSTGSVTGVAAGSTNLTVKAGSMTSPSFALTVTAAAPVLTGVSPICPGSVAVGQTATCTAQCTYNVGPPASCTGASFNSLSSGIASINSSTGLLTGVTTGTTNIAATLSAFYGATAVTVTSSSPPVATLASVAVSCTPNSVQVGSQVNCAASCTYSDATTTNCTTADAHGTTAGTWLSSLSGVATVGSSTGIATGVAVGSTNLTVVAGAFTSPAYPFTVVAVPSTTILGNNQYNVSGSDYGNYNQLLYVKASVTSTVSSCTFSLGAGTQAAGKHWDCGIIPATSATAQGTAWLCHNTYTTTGTSADQGYHTVSLNGCGTITSGTAYFIATNTDQNGPVGQGYWSCAAGTSPSCTGSAPTSGNGTYACRYISATYGTYTGMGTATSSGCGAGNYQASQYITLTSPQPTLTNGYLTTPGNINSLAPGSSAQVYAVACYSDSNCYLASPSADQYGDTFASITSSNPAVATVGAVGSAHPGLVTAISVGTATISSTLTGGRATSPYIFTVSSPVTPLPPLSSRSLTAR